MTQTIDDLSRLEVRRWDLSVGNASAKQQLLDLVRAVRIQKRRAGFRLLFRGPSRSGKTSLIQYAVKCIGCFNLDVRTLDACHTCPNCRLDHHLYGNAGWEHFANYLDGDAAPTPMYYRYSYIDCTRITTGELDAIIEDLGSQKNVTYVVFLDEIHRLVRRQLDERLLVPTDRQDVIWIGASVRLDELEEMFVNRFRIIDMDKPAPDELVAFLARVCAEFGLRCEEPAATLKRLADRSNLVTGTALQVLNAAYQSEAKTLTAKLVEEYVYRRQD